VWLYRCHATTARKSTRHSDPHLSCPKLSQLLCPKRLLEIPEIFFMCGSIGVIPPPPTNPPDTLTSTSLTSLTPTFATPPSQRLLEIPEIFLCVALSVSRHHRTQVLLTLLTLLTL
jgi:hypothetical protein